MSQTHNVHPDFTLSERAHVVLPAGTFGNFEAGFFLKRGHASHVWDEQDNRYIDYLIGSGPMLLGHGHPEVITAVEEQLHKGLTFFTNNLAGVELAEHICEAVTCADQVRYVSTGGEADMYAMRLARAHTKRDKILKFEGGYHGMSAESLMSLAPTSLRDFPAPAPDSAGIPRSVSEHVLVAPYNDTDHVCQMIDDNASELAAVIVEPMQRIIPPTPGFLEALRERTRKHNIVLIFDEVVTGFRLAYGGAQAYYDVVPDICTLGKVIGGGFALAAIAGNASIMSHFDKQRAGEQGFTPQIGTLSGNPMAAVAGIKTLEILRRDGQYDRLNHIGILIQRTLTDALTEQGIAHQVVGEPALFDVVFCADPVNNYRDFLAGDKHNAQHFNQLLRQRGILKSDSKWYISLGLTDNDVEQTQLAITDAANQLAKR